MNDEEVVYNAPPDTCERCGARVGLEKLVRHTFRMWQQVAEIEVCPACDAELEEELEEE